MESRLLRVDLTTGECKVETVPHAMFERWIGGSGINNWIMWEHFLTHDINCDPRGPDNIFVFGVGPLAATGSGSGIKGRITFKSPCYGIFGDSAAGGKFPYMVRFAGFDYIAITGKAPKPVYLHLCDGDVEIRDASHLWGMNSAEAHNTLVHDLGDFPSAAHTLTIGQAGEHQVGIASVVSDASRIHARGGGGCVLGSKNLKAIAVQGSGGVRVANPRGLLNWSKDFRQKIDQNEAIYGFKRRGTLGAVEMYQHIGSHFWRNNQGNMFRGDDVRSDNWVKKYHKYSEVCSADCYIACDGRYKIDGTESEKAKKYVGESFRRPEYLTTASAAGALDLRDWSEVAHWGKVTNDYGIDNQDLSTSISFIMELEQHGLLSARQKAELFDRDHQSLEWGCMEDVEELMKDMVFQRNRFGKFFHDGPYYGALRYSQFRGENFMKYATYGKGGASFTEEMRPFPTWMNNMAVASRGADHLKGIGLIEKFQRRDLSMKYFGRLEAADLSTPLLKGACTAVVENQVALLNSYGVCLFHWMLDPGGYTPEDYYGRAFAEVTGIDRTPEELMRDGERICNLEKAFNSRLGLRREHDTICERWMFEPCPEGMYPGKVAADMFETVLDEYYDWRGWDRQSGLQTGARLSALGMDDVAEVLAADGALAKA
ncbi:MAG: aldehyde ferredoxin oxidoreductase C-terminal domain-containing protein [Gammaproteobacteria bacterium]|jgi:aldehyde:ferredoxin oxidoreductase|nr:aldehyde ferredoxin oxidoreductase C-terminal domain-containing protein [Gammaproteobacteria bacterium]